MSQAKFIRCLPELSLNNNVVNPDFLKNRSLFFFRENNELFWNRCTELSEMTHQLCSVTVALSANAHRGKGTRRAREGTADLLRANHTGLFLEEHSVCRE